MPREGGLEDLARRVSSACNAATGGFVAEEDDEELDEETERYEEDDTIASVPVSEAEPVAGDEHLLEEEYDHVFDWTVPPRQSSEPPTNHHHRPNHHWEEEREGKRRRVCGACKRKADRERGIPRKAEWR